ncbi:hypothetical protein BKA70DRAFT_1291241 [Coprinopsis sp. MPI-PUGE-AT-0042]|nr:hypothetical protein BKA70DRAFT_1291241 [Coprinopsis sp. MPI-PUGE-AT-0042]
MVYSTIDDKSAAKDDAHAYLLEQMKIEMFRMLQEFQQSLPSSISGTGAYLTSLTINGGTFNVVGRDVHNHIYTYHIPKDDRKASIFTKLMGKLGWERKRYIKHHDTRSTHDASALPITASSPVLPVPDGNQQVTEILRQALCATPTTAGGPPMEKTKVGAATSKMTATFRAAAKASERAPTKGKNKAA